MNRNRFKLSILLILTISLTNIVRAQNNYKPKLIKDKGNYFEKFSKTTFPITIDNYIRTEITSFDKNQANIGATYEDNLNGAKTTISVFVYPVGASNSKSLLRDEYLSSLNSIATAADKDLVADQHYCSYKNDGYKINGFSAYIIKEHNSLTTLQIYQCGSWYLKIRLTSDVLDSIGMDNLNKKILEVFNPVNIVKSSNLSLKSSVLVSRKTQGDSLFLGCTMSSAFKRMEWVEKNIDTLERASGFPDLYLEMHIESWKDFIKFADEHKDWHLSALIKNYIDQLNSLIENGFLDEYIMQQYSNVMIVPYNYNFDSASYHDWIKTHPINLNLNEKLYLITYNTYQ